MAFLSYQHSLSYQHCPPSFSPANLPLQLNKTKRMSSQSEGACSIVETTDFLVRRRQDFSFHPMLRLRMEFLSFLDRRFLSPCISNNHFYLLLENGISTSQEGRTGVRMWGDVVSNRSVALFHLPSQAIKLYQKQNAIRSLQVTEMSKSCISSADSDKTQFAPDNHHSCQHQLSHSDERCHEAKQ